MTSTNSITATSRFLLIAAACVVIIAGMRGAAPILVPFLLSVFIAIISAPALFWLKDKGLPDGAALLLVIATIAIIGGGILIVAGASIESFSRALPDYQARLQEQTAALFNWLGGYGIIIDAHLKSFINPGQIMGMVGGVFNGLGKMLANAFLIFLTVIFILLEASGFQHKIANALDDPEASLKRFKVITHNINHYLAIKTWASLATGVIIALWLFLLDVDFPVLWGLLAFFLNYVPNIGAIIAAIPAVLVALVQLGPMSALWTATAFLVVNNVIGNLLEPRYMGTKLGLSALVVFLSLVFWGWVLGPVGMLLSVPLTVAAKIAMEAREETHWIAVLLSNEQE